ncbi:MAG: hypothetical protein EBT86_02465 [Actinobacteria bacterium]|nr:hypothetical protein [Actinomycetota bacterium]
MGKLLLLDEDLLISDDDDIFSDLSYVSFFTLELFQFFVGLAVHERVEEIFTVPPPDDNPFGMDLSNICINI